MGTGHIAVAVENRIVCYRILSAAYCLPEDEFLSEEEVQILVDALGALGSAAESDACRMRDAVKSESSKDLRVAYAALFVGPFHVPAPPYGSVYLEAGRKLLGDSTLDVITRYRSAGIEVNPEQQDLPDHVAIELEFAAFLAAMELHALSEGNDEARRSAVTQQASFLDDHLCEWIPKFAGAVRDCDPPRFYDALLSCTELFLAEELSRARVVVAV